jgi:antitoxin component of RelBE/YafQ-DinJ toxin-antitoxin module
MAFQPPEFLTFEEVAEVDKALLTAQDKFLARVSLYSLRALKQIAQAENLPVDAITDRQVAEWIEQDESLRQAIGADASFQQFFTQLVLSSLLPLRQISQATGVMIDDLTISQVVSWFEQQAKIRLANQ